jgi:S1-C subfamily serine protease
MVLTSRSMSLLLSVAALAAAPLLLAAQQCPAERREADLGFSGIDCVQCTLHMRGKRVGWMEFGAEPAIRHIRAGGPGEGKLRDGDVVVVVNGHPITTEVGGHLFADPEIGKPLRLTIRRGGREREVEIVPIVRCTEEPEEAVDTASLSRPGLERGLLGFGVACSWCAFQTQPDGREVWEFKDYPGVVAIDSMGPAARAGLRPGDTLRAIDGFGLLTSEGGRRFGAIRPGDMVHLTVQRNGVQRVIELTAVSHRREP